MSMCVLHCSKCWDEQLAHISPQNIEPPRGCWLRLMAGGPRYALDQFLPTLMSLSEDAAVRQRAQELFRLEEATKAVYVHTQG